MNEAVIRGGGGRMPASVLSDLETAVLELRCEEHRAKFSKVLGRVVGLLEAIPDSAPASFTFDVMGRLRELADEAVTAVELRIDSGRDSESVQRHLAWTIYEIRRRTESVEMWFRHFSR
jgi:hypothetical protein